MEMGPKDQEAGLNNLITLVGYRERSAGVNDQAHLPAVRQVLAGMAGWYFLSEVDVRRWYRQE